MTDLTFSDPCIIFAMARESSAFRREFRPHQRFAGAPCRARFCGPSWLTVLVLETGIGRSRTEQALDWLFGGPVLGNVPYRPKLVLSAGFAGALQGDQHVGDIVLATEVVDEEGNRWPVPWPGNLPPGEWRPPLHRGRLLSVNRLVARPEQKRAVGQKFEALAVDMETATVARRCSREAVPFGCVRAISDSVDTPLSPKLVALLSREKVSLVRTLSALIRTPVLALELRRLARDTKRAADLLGKALGELLTLTLEWMEEK